MENKYTIERESTKAKVHCLKKTNKIDILKQEKRWKVQINNIRNKKRRQL